MNESMVDLKEKAKHLLAGFLFVSFVIGGCGAAFSLFAAAISSLQNVDVRYVEPTTVTSPLSGVPSGPEQSSRSETGSPLQQPQPVQTGGTTEQPFPAQPDEPLSHMHSPIGDAMDNGGVYVGTRIQSAFGSMLKGVITTLFLEQNDESAQPSQATQGGGWSGRTSG